MYLRFRDEKPFISGNSRRKSADRRSMTLAPQPSRSCRSKISRPICHKSLSSSPVFSIPTSPSAVRASPRTKISRRRSALRSSTPAAEKQSLDCDLKSDLLLHASRREAGDEVALQGGEEGDDGDTGQEGAGHDEGRLADVELALDDREPEL